MRLIIALITWYRSQDHSQSILCNDLPNGEKTHLSSPKVYALCAYEHPNVCDPVSDLAELGYNLMCVSQEYLQ
jgi:hypothetical protein